MAQPVEGRGVQKVDLEEVDADLPHRGEDTGQVLLRAGMGHVEHMEILAPAVQSEHRGAGRGAHQPVGVVAAEPGAGADQERRDPDAGPGPVARIRSTMPSRDANRREGDSQSPISLWYQSSSWTTSTGSSLVLIASRFSSTSACETSVKYWYQEHHVVGGGRIGATPLAAAKPAAPASRPAPRPTG